MFREIGGRRGFVYSWSGENNGYGLLNCAATVGFSKRHSGVKAAEIVTATLRAGLMYLSGSGGGVVLRYWAV